MKKKEVKVNVPEQVLEEKLQPKFWCLDQVKVSAYDDFENLRPHYKPATVIGYTSYNSRTQTSEFKFNSKVDFKISKDFFTPDMFAKSPRSPRYGFNTVTHLKDGSENPLTADNSVKRAKFIIVAVAEFEGMFYYWLRCIKTPEPKLNEKQLDVIYGEAWTGHNGWEQCNYIVREDHLEKSDENLDISNFEKMALWSNSYYSKEHQMNLIMDFMLTDYVKKSKQDADTDTVKNHHDAIWNAKDYRRQQEKLDNLLNPRTPSVPLSQLSCCRPMSGDGSGVWSTLGES